ncbi:hypothetical protein AAON49_12995 [Pseudotenacibaculum sp. MALMAid0570]|uniref:hypothetical protein n=1 Tax=Pseudotenacibaculum sp. MALMAid0570 TaxID=3143938 RepID=UPI0032DE8745
MKITLIKSLLKKVQLVEGEGLTTKSLKVKNNLQGDSSLLNLPIISSALRRGELLQISSVFFYSADYEDVKLSSVEYGDSTSDCLHLQIGISSKEITNPSPKKGKKEKEGVGELVAYHLFFSLVPETNFASTEKVKIVFSTVGDPEGDRGTETTVQDDDD